jgi:ABC-type ATPase involved in cell division
MSQKQFRVQLSEQEHLRLQKIVRSGKDKARKIARCRILLLADEPNGKTDEEISDVLNVCLATIHTYSGLIIFQPLFSRQPEF